MYRIEDKASAIKEVQRLLKLNQTGIYDNYTRGAVSSIQRIHNIEENGTVNYETFNAIIAEYKKKEAESRNYGYLFNPTFPYVVENMDENVRLINDALRLVLNDYVYEGTIPRGKYLGIDTINAVKFLQNVFKMPISEEIDQAFVNRLLLEKNAIEAKIEHGK